jgi:hypothetical protein
VAYDIRFERDGRVLRVTYTGRVDIAERRAAAVKALECATHDGINRFLLDYRQATSLVGDEPSNQALARYLVDKLGHRDARVAWLVTHDHQLSPGVEDLTHSLGVVSRRFNDLDAAFAWLDRADIEELGAPPATDSPPRRALALAMQASDPRDPMPPVQFAAIVKLVQELLDAGMEETVALGVARRMFDIVRIAPTPR